MTRTALGVNLEVELGPLKLRSPVAAASALRAALLGCRQLQCAAAAAE